MTTIAASGVSLSWRRVAAQVTTYACLLLAIASVLAPIYWMVTTSLKSARDIYRTPTLWPTQPTLTNYMTLITDKGFMRSILNSVIVAGSTTIISVTLASFAAYAIARYRFRGRNLLSRTILFAYLTPVSMLFIPLAIVMAQIGLGNSMQGLVLSYLSFSLPLSTWLLIGYFREVPRELEEQAMIDGTSRLGAIIRIVMPLSAPGIAAVSIFTFTGAWNELLLGLVLITSESQRTVSVALNFLITDDMLPWGPLMAGSTLSSVPLMILYFVAQRFILRGVTEGGVKG